MKHACGVGDYMYPAEPDYEGTKEMLPPLTSCTAEELTGSGRRLNRVVFSNRTAVRSVSQVDTTVEDTTPVDNLLQNGTVMCNI